jgi:hypothetical protein
MHILSLCFVVFFLLFVHSVAHPSFLSLPVQVLSSLPALQRYLTPADAQKVFDLCTNLYSLDEDDYKPVGWFCALACLFACAV